MTIVGALKVGERMCRLGSLDLILVCSEFEVWPVGSVVGFPVSYSWLDSVCRCGLDVALDYARRVLSVYLRLGYSFR